MFLINTRLCSWLLQKWRKCNKAVDNYPHASEFVPECFMTQKMCDKAVNTYPSTIRFVTKCFMTWEMCDKAVNRCSLYLSLFLISITQKMCESIISEDLFSIRYVPDQCKT